MRAQINITYLTEQEGGKFVVQDIHRWEFATEYEAYQITEALVKQVVRLNKRRNKQ